jgi:hypothetical protein
MSAQIGVKDERPDGEIGEIESWGKDFRRWVLGRIQD